MSFYVVRARYEPSYMCFTHERVCNCLYRCHAMLFVLVLSHVFLLMKECVIVYSVSFYVVRARYEPCYMCFYS